MKKILVLALALTISGSIYADKKCCKDKASCKKEASATQGQTQDMADAAHAKSSCGQSSAGTGKACCNKSSSAKACCAKGGHAEAKAPESKPAPMTPATRDDQK